MSKKKKKKKEGPHDSEGSLSSATRGQSETGTPPKMNRKEYEREMRRLHGELVALQEWVKSSGAKICIVFEGRDTAGKGGTIKRITERVSPRVGGDDEPSESCPSFFFFLLIRHLRSMRWRSLNEALCPARIDLRSTEPPK